MQYVPQTGSIRRPFATWLLVLAFALAICSLIIAAPLAIASGHSSIAFNIYRPFSYLCHQIPARSFYFAEHPFAVCSRCTGIYSGFVLGAIVYPVLRSFRNTSAPPRKWLFLALVPLAIDVALELLGIWHNTHSSRFLTGALLGCVVAFYILPGLIELSLRERRGAKASAPSGGAAPASLAANISAAPSDYSSPHRRI